ncbi:MAG: Hpt domain-containing protein [Lachnospiraceae bacterium]|nr:Hpt domain-containing protein [Lachnospiraceae bacterium]
MTIEELYQASGNDYNELLGRLFNAKLIEKLVKKYRDDQNYKQLCDGVAQKDREKVFTAAHTIKGLALNLGFSQLAQAATALTEATRNSYPDNVPALFDAVQKEQEKILALIDQLN